MANVGIDYGQYCTNRHPPVICGPASVSISSLIANAMAVLEVSTPEASLTPNGSVVIPADRGGPVNIILESSVDLINWTPAFPITSAKLKRV